MHRCVSCEEKEGAGLCPANALQALHAPPKYCQLLFIPGLIDLTTSPTWSCTDAAGCTKRHLKPIALGPSSLEVVYIYCLSSTGTGLHVFP